MENKTLAQLEQEAKRRLFPPITDPSWLVLSKRREILRGWVQRLPAHRLRVLDVGGRIQPYRPLIKDREVEYIAIDLQSSPLVNVLGNAERMPFGAQTFDFVICTQMLEYAPKPQRVIDEIYRVLKTGGQLFLSAPSVYPRDSDYDAWRFLPASLRELLREFSEVEIAPEGSSISGFYRSICACLSFAKPAALRTALRYSLVPVLNLKAAGLEKIFPRFNDTFSANLSVWARK